jgi:hypothetical protein
MLPEIATAPAPAAPPAVPAPPAWHLPATAADDPWAATDRLDADCLIGPAVG